jgi:hypothetical protein
MNKERLLILADHIENRPILYTDNPDDELEELREKDSDIILKNANNVAFNMYSYVIEGSCGTAACIAGHACFLWKNEIEQSPSGQVYWHSSAAAILGLTEEESNHIFYGRFITDDLFSDKNWAKITPKVAADYLREVAERGYVL